MRGFLMRWSGVASPSAENRCASRCRTNRKLGGCGKAYRRCVETARAEEISLEQWVELTRYYDDHPLKDKAQDGGELFDVVDEEDQRSSGRRPVREVVHREDLLHRAVHVFVFNKHRKELFLQKRSRRLKDKHPGVWDSSAAGHLDAGEGYQEDGGS